MTKKVTKVFESGDRVFAKVRGYPAWPARVSSKADKSGGKYHVFFYGTYETAVVKREDMWTYSPETKEKFGKQKRKGFAEGLLELETNPNICLEAPQEVVDTHVTSDVPSAAVDTAAAAALIEDEETPLTIDEGKKEVKKGKRKADEMSGTPTAPPAAKVSKVAAFDVATPQRTEEILTPASSGGGLTSRSGRVIRQKKFADDDVESTPHKSGSAPAAEKKAEPRKMWVHVKGTGDVLEINLDKDRPVKFETKDAEIRWEKATAKNALKFKQKVESGDFIPEEIRQKIEKKAVRTEQEEDILKKEKVLACRKEKVRWLKVEQRLIDVDIAIKTALHFKHPDMPKCLELLEELTALQVAPLMFKKQPDIVTTIRKLRKYIGPQEEPRAADMAEEWSADAAKIRLKADAVFHRIQSCFAVPEGSSFWETFDAQLEEFRDMTKEMDQNQVLHMVTDPTKKSD